MQPLYIRNAESSVDRFVELEDGVMLESAQAVDCLDCEACLSAGIHSFRFIQEADSMLRLAILQGSFEFDADELDRNIKRLLTRWIARVERAFAWIERCQKNGYTLDNLAEFKICVAEVFAILNFDPDREMSEEFKRLRDKAVVEHRNGETVDCFSEDE
ncbi:MAG: hypothetical protein SFV81_17300 [Pirellulaceae bacterium]|nr:hypothetical protein [Pirellulaceae bacterium]